MNFVMDINALSSVSSGLILVLYVTFGHIVSLVAAKGLQEVCHFEDFEANCGEHEVVVMQSAHYGLMRVGRCMDEHVKGKDCTANVLSYMDSLCSGKRNCSVRVADEAMHNLQPCKVYLGYLEAEYDCIKVVGSNPHQCSVFDGQRLPGGPQPGFISSSTLPFADPASLISSGAISIPQGPGTQPCPWMLEGQKGQRFNLTLLNFVPTEPDAASQCYASLVVVDGNVTKSVPLCMQRSRISPIFTSTHHAIRMYIRGAARRLAKMNFIIKYQVHGCPDITNLTSATVTRTGDVTKVKCNLTGETFYVTCEGASWKGELGNCTKVPLGAEKNRDNDESFPYGLLIVIGIGVALGVALGIILLFGILFCLRRRKKPEHPRSHTTDPLLHSETPQESEDTGAGSWYSTRAGAGIIVKDVICPHGLATLARHTSLSGTLQSKHQGHYADSTELQRAMPLGESAANCAQPHPPMIIPLNGPDRGELTHYPSPEPPRICRPQSPGRDLDPGPAEMQTSFITFKPQTPVKGRTLDSEHSVDLIKDSQPYRQLNPETLVLECTCTLRHGQHMGPKDCIGENLEVGNKSV